MRAAGRKERVRANGLEDGIGNTRMTARATEPDLTIRRGEITDPWLARMLARKPKMLVAVALANRTARMVWALTTKKEIHRVRAAA